MSETSRYRHLTVKYCYDSDGVAAVGLDVASQGDPVVPWAFQLDLPAEEFFHYSSGHKPHIQYQLYGYAQRLPIADGSLAWIYSSHFLEDELNWGPILREWTRVLRKGGKLIIMLPDKERWNYAIHHLGQPVNCAHKHEGFPGELSTYAEEMGWRVIEDRLTECHPNDYNILFVGEKL